MDLEQRSIDRIKLAALMSVQYYNAPLICTYSGGKDSDVMLELFKRAGVNFEVVNSHTTVDAPQTVYHIRDKFKELEEQGISIFHIIFLPLTIFFINYFKNLTIFIFLSAKTIHII